MDIMATLHHGLLVDPTNSRQIADALIKILTNSEVWDEMSHNGELRPSAERRECPARQHSANICSMLDP